MNIDIDDNVPMPGDAWTSNPAEVARTIARDIAKQTGLKVDEAAFDKAADYLAQPVGPSATDCTFVGGPLNGKFGPVKGDKKVVEIELYGPKGEVTSVELYALGDMHPTPTFRYHIGTKPQ